MTETFDQKIARVLAERGHRTRVMLFVGSTKADAVPCQFADEWVRDHKVERIELYQSDAQLLGRLVWCSEQDVRRAVVMHGNLILGLSRRYADENTADRIDRRPD